MKRRDKAKIVHGVFCRSMRPDATRATICTCGADKEAGNLPTARAPKLSRLDQHLAGIKAAGAATYSITHRGCLDNHITKKSR